MPTGSNTRYLCVGVLLRPNLILCTAVGNRDNSHYQGELNEFLPKHHTNYNKLYST